MTDDLKSGDLERPEGGLAARAVATADPESPTGLVRAALDEKLTKKNAGQASVESESDTPLDESESDTPPDGTHAALPIGEEDRTGSALDVPWGMIEEEQNSGMRPAEIRRDGAGDEQPLKADAFEGSELTDDNRIEAFLPPGYRDDPVVMKTEDLMTGPSELVSAEETPGIVSGTSASAGEAASADAEEPLTLIKRLGMPEGSEGLTQERMDRREASEGQVYDRGATTEQSDMPSFKQVEPPDSLEAEPERVPEGRPIHPAMHLEANPHVAHSRQKIGYDAEEEGEYDPAVNRWWILPLVAAVVFFLAGLGAGRYLDGVGWPWERDAARTDKQTLVTMAVPPPGVPGAMSGTSAPATANDASHPLALPSKDATPTRDATPSKDAASKDTAPSRDAASKDTAPSRDAASKDTAPSRDAASKDTAPSRDGSSAAANGQGAGETAPLSDEVTAQPQPVPGDDSEIGLQYEESLPHEPSSEEVPPATPPDGRGGPPRIAVVIDDLGYNGPVSLGIARLPESITLAILPGGDFSRQVVTVGKSTHKEIILHQPMEPLGYPRTKPGPGALLNGMGHDEIRTILSRNLEKFPEVIGINNHMGSRLTQNREAMDAVMELLKERDLFFLDSRTSQTSVGYARAKAGGVPAARRDVFLDNVPKVASIEARLADLERIARHTGRAIGIGHPHAETLTALRNWLPAVTKRGIRIEGISHFLTTTDSAHPPRPAPPIPPAESQRESATPEKSALNNKPVKLKSETQLVRPVQPARLPQVPPPVMQPPAPLEEPSSVAPQIVIRSSRPGAKPAPPPAVPAAQELAKPASPPAVPPAQESAKPALSPAQESAKPAPPAVPAAQESAKPALSPAVPPAKPVESAPAKPVPLDPDDPAAPPPGVQESHDVVLPVDR
ncbi:MAG: divergent polysaccharide deacetylase family protein [Magnetococcus sp. YQC-9]